MNWDRIEGNWKQFIRKRLFAQSSAKVGAHHLRHSMPRL